MKWATEYTEHTEYNGATDPRRGLYSVDSAYSVASIRDPARRPLSEPSRQRGYVQPETALAQGSKECGALRIGCAHDAERHIPGLGRGNERRYVVGYIRRRCLPIAGKTGCERTVDGGPGGQ